MDKIVIGIDQSYTRTGVALIINNKVEKYKLINFKGCKTKTDKRKAVHRFILKVLKSLTDGHVDPQDITIICERIRTFSGKYGLRPAYLISTGALIATIVDTAYEFNVPVYSVDTRAWKSRIVGNSKAKIINGKRDAKLDTLNFVNNKLGIDIGDKDDIADAICIGLYGFLDPKEQNLKKEN